jgi:hypothetical protein
MCGSVVADTCPTDTEIRQQLVAELLRNYDGNCPCPYNVDRAGRQCGVRSAYSRPGGRSPMCYVHEVPDEMVAARKPANCS